jgi:hypothetical protein
MGVVQCVFFKKKESCEWCDGFNGAMTVTMSLRYSAVVSMMQ